MTGISHPPGTERLVGRLIGAHQGTHPGPLVICVAGIHGNERAGIPAVQRVLAGLESADRAFSGRFVAMAGNIGALERNQRFVYRDLNRSWSEEGVEATRRAVRDKGILGAATSPEDHEQVELLEALEAELSRRKGPAFFLDLHTSSAEGPPFLTVGDTLRNRRFALRLGLPLVLGLEEQVDGALLEYINNLGHVTVGVEGGQHGSEEAVDRHEAVLWLALEAAGCLAGPAADEHHQQVRSAAPGGPGIVEVRHRHAVRPGDGFRMQPGFKNFDRLRRGQVVAEDQGGPIRVGEDCGVLLPLYQEQGDDGFFTVREVRPFWLWLSYWIRRSGLPDRVTLLPGVNRHPVDPGTLVVNTRVARLFPLQVLHLLGYRKRRRVGSSLLVSRRRFDLRGPDGEGPVSPAQN